MVTPSAESTPEFKPLLMPKIKQYTDNADNLSDKTGYMRVGDIVMLLVTYQPERERFKYYGYMSSDGVISSRIE
jgi:hypothetical protein